MNMSRMASKGGRDLPLGCIPACSDDECQPDLVLCAFEGWCFLQRMCRVFRIEGIIMSRNEVFRMLCQMLCLATATES